MLQQAEQACAALSGQHVASMSLQALVQVVGKGLRDAHVKVRGQAAFALGQLAEHCQPEINDNEVEEQAFYALVAFCDSLGG